MALDKEKIKYIVGSDSTIEEAWSIIENNQHRSVIVIENEKVVGTLSDGDLRKAMLSRRLLSRRLLLRRQMSRRQQRVPRVL